MEFIKKRLDFIGFNILIIDHKINNLNKQNQYKL